MRILLIPLILLTSSCEILEDRDELDRDIQHSCRVETPELVVDCSSSATVRKDAGKDTKKAVVP